MTEDINKLKRDVQKAVGDLSKIRKASAHIRESFSGIHSQQYNNVTKKNLDEAQRLIEQTREP